MTVPIANGHVGVHSLPLSMTQAPGLPIWLWGVIICIIATALTSLGLVLQKLSHTLNAQKPDNEKRTVYYRQPWWIAGFAIFVVAQLINLISMSMAPQVMLSCLGATALVFNAVFAWLILEEELHLFEVGLIFGMLFSVMMVISTTPVLDSDPAAIDVFAVSVAPLFEGKFLLLGAGTIASLTFLRFVVIESAWAQQVPDLPPVIWTLCAAVASGYTVNLFKATSEFVMAWPVTQPLLHWQCYVVLAGACAAGAAQVHCLNCALNLGSAMMVVPTYFSLALLAQLGISEAIVVDVPQTIGGTVIFISGIVLVLVFLFVLVRAKIAYEEQPDAELNEVLDRALQSWPSSPMKNAITEATSLLSEGPSTPPKFNIPQDAESPMAGMTASFTTLSARERGLSISTYDCESFQDSFEGRDRTYTVSVIGLGIA